MTTVRKSIRGTWEAVDSIELVASRVLKVSTHKTSSGQLVTTATVHLHDGQFLSHRMYTDFSQRLMATTDRCTEKNVIAQHACAMTKINEVHSAITQWYATEEAAVV